MTLKTKIVTKNDIEFHSQSTNGLFWYQGRLLRIEKNFFNGAFGKIVEANCNIIQPGFKSEIQVDLKGIDTKHNQVADTYEHKIYKHHIRIQESPITRVKVFLIAICQMHIEMLKYKIIANDIHEGNIVDTIDGVKWLDWGAFRNLNEDNSKIAFVLTCYLIHKYLFKTPISDHEHICLDDIRNLGEPLSSIVDLDYTEADSWKHLIEIVETHPVTLDKSHWSENYSNTMDIEHPELLGGKGINVCNILQELDYETVTDVGCNKGFYSFSAAKKAKSVIGFDLVPACIDIAQTFNQQFKLPTIFSVKTIESILDNKMFETDRYRSDLVLALAIVHHVHDVITPSDFVKTLISISNKYILLEDIGGAEYYEQLFLSQNCELVKRVDSSPLPRSLSLYRKL